MSVWNNSPTIRLFRLFKTKKWLVSFLFLLVLATTVLDLVAPLILQRLIDQLTQLTTKSGLTTSGIGVFAIPALGLFLALVGGRVVRTIYNYYLFKEVTGIEDDVRMRVKNKYFHLHMMFHHGSSSGQIIGRIERGASAIYAILHDIFGQNLLPPLTIFIGVMLTMFYKNPWIASVAFFPLPIYILSTKRISEKIYEIEKRVNDEFEAISKEAYDVAANILTTKKFFQEDAEVQNIRLLLRQARMTQYSAERLWGLMEVIQTAVIAVGSIAVFLLAGFFVQKGSITIGEFVLFLSLHGMAYAPMAQLSNILPRLRRNSARVERLFGILDEPILVSDKSGAPALPPHTKLIEFCDVWFRYEKGRRWALKNVSVKILAGKTVALVGKSGSGKTTFVNILLRSFDPDRGVVSIDGFNLRDVTRESLLNQIAVVPQEVDLFSRSIFANIAYGKPEVELDEVVHAAKNALAHEFIMRTKKKYDTLVGERGVRLSGGERQRIGIARAILRNPSILILDEATSHLDTESERMIAEATQALIKDRTTFIIAHRLSTIIHADMILVFSKGELEAIGRHEELLTTSPTYQRLYSFQFRDMQDFVPKTDNEYAEEDDTEKTGGENGDPARK